MYGKPLDRSTAGSHWSWDDRGFWVSSRYGPSGEIEYDYKYPLESIDTSATSQSASYVQAQPSVYRHYSSSSPAESSVVVQNKEKTTDATVLDPLAQTFQNFNPYKDAQYVGDSERGWASRDGQMERVGSTLIETPWSASQLQVFQQIAEPSRFFKVGRVFKTPWSEQAGNTSSDEGCFVTESFGTKFFTKTRHFVVVREKHGCSLCLAFFTHNGQGATKSGIRNEDYAAVYPVGGTPRTAIMERMTKEPLCIIVEDSREAIDPMSRLNFGRVYTVEYNVKVLKVGRIVDEHLPLLNRYFISSNGLELPGDHSRKFNLRQPIFELEREGSYSSFSTGLQQDVTETEFSFPKQASSSYLFMPGANAREYESDTAPSIVNEAPNIPTKSPHPVVDQKFREVEPKKAKKFWVAGRVFMCLWTEPARAGSLTSQRASSSSSSGSHISKTFLNGVAYSEIRRFVVLSAGYGNSLCSPIHSYGGQATLKTNLPETKQHAIIYTSDVAPLERTIIGEDGSETREDLIKAPIRVNREALGEEGELNPMARLNYSKIYTVEHYVLVHNIGMVHQQSMPELLKSSFVIRNEPPQGPRYSGSRGKKTSRGSAPGARSGGKKNAGSGTKMASGTGDY